MKLDAFLRKTPQPVAVLADAQRIEVPKSGRPWRDLAQTIETLAPSKVTCLDGQGQVIRAMDLEASEEDGPKSQAPEPTLNQFARLLAEGYERGSKVNQPLLDNALAFIERLSARLSKAESEIERLRGINARLVAENLQLKTLPTGEAGEEGGIVAALVQGIAAAATEQQGGAPIPIQKKAGTK